MYTVLLDEKLLIGFAVIKLCSADFKINFIICTL